jgi:hypothetical protein
MILSELVGITSEISRKSQILVRAAVTELSVVN